MQPYFKVPSKQYSNVTLRVFPRHFVTPNSRFNEYMDITPMKCRLGEAQSVAKALSEIHYFSTPVDTIVCMDGMEMVGGFFAQELTRAGVISMNMHKTIYVLTPEYSQSGQMIFRSSIQKWIRGKNVLLLLATATTGKTVAQALESLKYYGATISGISAIFSVATKIAGLPVYSLFSKSDLPEYKTFSPEECPFCRAGEKVDAICNGYGFTPLS